MKNLLFSVLLALAGNSSAATWTCVDTACKVVASGNSSRLASAIDPADTVLPAPVSRYQQEKLDELAAAYQSAIISPIAYMATTFHADEISQSDLQKVLIGLGGTTPSGLAWRDSTGASIAMTNAQLQGLASAMVMRGLGADANLQAKKAAVNAATTVAGVQAVIW